MPSGQNCSRCKRIAERKEMQDRQEVGQRSRKARPYDPRYCMLLMRALVFLWRLHRTESLTGVELSLGFRESEGRGT
jgi:hypothetical protein